MLSLNFTNRKKSEKKDSYLPAVFYGPEQNSTPIFINTIEFTSLYRKTGKSAVFLLEGEGLKLQAMTHEISYDPVKNSPIHIDFYIIEKGAKVTTHVPLNFIGISDAVKSLGGTLVKVRHEIQIEAEVVDLPQAIDVDISILINLDSVIHVQDIKLPAGVILHHVNEKDIIASIAVKKEEDFSTPEKVDLSTIKVEEKGKKEEEATSTEAAE